MRAVQFERYGPPEVLQHVGLPVPVPKDNEILIRVYATTVTAADRRLRSLDLPRGFKLIMQLAVGFKGPRKPAVTSMELAGRVAAVGRTVKRFAVGDDVFAFDPRMGACAEYKCMPEDGAVMPKPPNLSYGEAAALSFGGTTALSYLQRGKLERGQKLLVVGASGGVGTAAVQLGAKYFGAEVTGVCSTANLELVESLGAYRVIDYSREDFSRNGEQYDVIMDTVGTAPFARAKQSLKAGGRLLQVVGTFGDLLKAPWLSWTTGHRIVIAPASVGPLPLVAELAGKGIFQPYIDRRYPFEQIVEAHRYVDTKRKRGNVIIDLIPDEPREPVQ